jgi:hypothetical protein
MDKTEPSVQPPEGGAASGPSNGPAEIAQVDSAKKVYGLLGLLLAWERKPIQKCE